MSESKWPGMPNPAAGPVNWSLAEASIARNLPRKSFDKARTGTKNFLREGIHWLPPAKPPPVAMKWIWGWYERFWPHVWRIPVSPGTAPRCLLSMASPKSDSEAALKNKRMLPAGLHRQGRQARRAK